MSQTMNILESTTPTHQRQEPAQIKQLYKEIAAMKTSIRQKEQTRKLNAFRIAKSTHHRGRSFNHYTTFPNAKLTLTHIVSSPTGSTNGNESSDSFSESPQQFMTVYSPTGTSLYNMSVYKQEAGRLVQCQSQQAKIAIKEYNMNTEHTVHTEKENAEARVVKNRIINDHCDRVEISNIKFSVMEGGKILYPLFPLPQSSMEELKWNDDIYKKHQGGYYKVCSRKIKTKSKPNCRYYTRTGICQRGASCNYFHDQSKIKICPHFLNDKCIGNSMCLLSHRPNEHNTPMCRYFLQGNCSNTRCRYMHSTPPHFKDPSCEVWVCRPFAIGGWCQRGRECPFMHIWNCPDFEEDGECVQRSECLLNHQYTLRTQELISTKSYKYIRGEDAMGRSFSEENDKDKENKISATCGIEGTKETKETGDTKETKETKEAGETKETSRTNGTKETGETKEASGTIGTKETNGTTRKIISSYTVDPKALLLTPTSSTYDYFIDENGVEAVEQKQKDADVSKSQFLINISHSDQESSLDSDSDGFDDLDCEAAFVGV